MRSQPYPYNMTQEEFEKKASEQIESQELYVYQLPEEWRSPALYLSQLKTTPGFFYDIPEDFLTEDFLLKAIQVNVLVFNQIPIEKLTPVICEAAVKSDPRHFERIPNELRNDQMYRDVLEQMPEFIEQIPSHILTDDFCKQLAKKNYRALNYFPNDKLYDDGICDAALEGSWNALSYIPEKMRTKTRCLNALSQDIEAIGFFPEEYINDDMCNELIEKKPTIISMLPKKYQTKDLYFKALRLDGSVLRSMPEEFLGHDAYQIAVETCGWILEDIPYEERTHDICLKALKNHSGAFQHIPSTIFSEDIAIAAVQCDPLLLRDIDDEYKSNTVCEIAVCNGGLALEFVPQAKRTKELCYLAVQNNSLALKDVPEELKPFVIEELTLEHIIAINYKAISYLPADIDYQKDIAKFLRQIKHIVVRPNYSPVNPYEAQDALLIYIHKDLHKGHTICVNSSDLETLFQEMDQNQAVELVLLDHTNADTTDMSDMTPEELVEIIKNKNIVGVKLLGCNTVHASRLEEEQKMIDEFIKRSQQSESIAMVLMSKQPSENDYDTIWKKLRYGKHKAERCYILIKEGNEYSLKYIERHSVDASTKEITYPLSKEQFVEMEMELNKHRTDKRFTFPKKGHGSVLYYRGGNSEELLSTSEIQFINSNYKSESKQKDKELYPNLANITISVDEAKNKLKPSFMQAVFNLLKDTKLPRFKYLTGFVKALHGDTKNKRYLVTRTHLHPSLYSGTYFFKGVGKNDNIRRNKLEKEQAKVNQMLTSESSNKTSDVPMSIVRSIKIKW